MRAVLLIAVVIGAFIANAMPTDYVSQFEAFKVKFGKAYESPKEEAKRFRIFVENMKIAAKHQAANPLATFGVNVYSDMSAAEFKTRHNAEKVYSKLKSQVKETVRATPAELAAAAGEKIDWRTKGAVTHVKNQGQCGSCWSFSTTGGVEGQWFLAGNTLTSLSEQLFVSCDTIDDGCQGGLMDNAFTWAINDNGGNLVTAESYPYVSGDGVVPACDKTGKTFGAHISGFENINKNETDMAAWSFTHGPLSIAVDATSWQTYTGGIMTNCVSQQLDHGVLIVGFDLTNSPPYWIIKNSWGPSWGEEGYIRVEFGTDQCMLTSYPCSSKVGPAPPTPPPTPIPPPTPAPPSPPMSHHWIDLFQPPYTGVPGVTMAISCITGTDCFVPGGQNGVGFDVFLFDGHRSGTFTPLNMPSQALMIMAIGMGGNKETPKGCVGGFGIGNGIQYAKNATTFEPSIVPTLFVETQDVRASANGMDVLVVDSAHALFSSDAGVTFSEKKINSGAPACAEGRYGAMLSASEWIVTMGSWPENNKKTKNSKQLSERVSVTRDAKGNVKRVSKSMLHQGSGSGSSNSGSASSGSNGPAPAPPSGSGSDNCGYTAVIAKTTDGGNTWTNVFNAGDNATFYFNAVDCSGSNCVAVAEGFNEDAAARIFHSSDKGQTWTLVKKLVSGSSGQYSLMSVAFRTGNEVWVAGSKEGSFSANAVFMMSSDAGKTWFDESGTLQNIGDVTDLSFTADGKHGFATAVTVYQDSTILRYGAALPPAPPSPPTSGPTGTFTQMQCEDSACSQGCRNISFNTGVCLPIQGGGSAIATCTATSLKEKVFQDSPSCTGASQDSEMPLDQCLHSNSGNYFENFCSSAPVPPSPPSPPSPPTPPAPTTTAAPTGSFTQMNCQNSGCTTGCQNATFHTGVCLPMNGGGSAIVTCTATTLNEEVFQSNNCQGASQSGSMPLDQCLQSTQGTYFENFCTQNGEVQVTKGAKVTQLQETLWLARK